MERIHVCKFIPYISVGTENFASLVEGATHLVNARELLTYSWKRFFLACGINLRFLVMTPRAPCFWYKEMRMMLMVLNIFVCRMLQKL
jgi:hypothetical protein